MDQPLEALAWGNHVRSYRSMIKREIRAGRIDIRELLSDPPDEVLDATVYQMIMALHYIGRTRTLYTLRMSDCSEFTKIGNLTRRQLDKLLRELP